MIAYKAQTYWMHYLPVLPNRGGTAEGARIARRGLGQESVLTADGGVASMELGLADVAEVLGPKINKAIKHNNQ